jgi:uncharacterized membrane protein
MAFCAKCGTSLAEGVVYCPSCGTPAGSAPSGGAAVPPVGARPMASNVAGLLAYLGWFITGIIFLVIEPYRNDKFVRFHAFQSIFFTIACFVISAAWGVIFGTLFFASWGVMWPLISLTRGVLRLGFFVLWLFLMFKAYNNERFMLPVIGDLAAKQAG